MLNQSWNFSKIPRRFLCSLEFENHWTRENDAMDLSLGEAEGKHMCAHKCTALRQTGPGKATPVLVWMPRTLASVLCHFLPPLHPCVHPSVGPGAMTCVHLSERQTLSSLMACQLRKKTMIFLSFLLFMWWTAFIDLQILSHPCIP